MQTRFFARDDHPGYRLANKLLSNGPDTVTRIIERVLEHENGVNELRDVCDFLRNESARKKNAAELQQYKLAILLSDIDEKSTISAALSKAEYDDMKLNGRYRQDNENSFVHEIVLLCYSDKFHQAPGLVAKRCDDTPYVYTTYRDNCAAETKILADACQAFKNCEQLMYHLQNIIEANVKSTNNKGSKC